ncbi:MULTISPECIES: neutral zinc metallopeptidase [unclassified Roseateles]|uniref:KPN_02809 family neutral zinc metallopeptidase n=1 Tax=unclassified Roseateles TaxID=2626991 RepID=UPI0006F359C0|nr:MULTISPECIES: neutral zinc metallopeptidase [unclassified Roseateles]KQW46528.1 metalloprotease [Pelomonas sp. Root405]KRA73579.1 metalloprotease [Pelomonas sp. Root662]
MKWEGQRESENVEDARGSGGGRGRGLPIGGRGLGVGGIVVALLASWALGINPLTVLGLLDGGGGGAPVQAPADDSHAQDPGYRFVKVVLADTEDVWGAYFQRSGQQYAMPKLRVFRGSEPTACGTGEAAMGPFYCPADRKVYIDLSFYDTLRERLGAPGDFAQAYVIAHEVGHHLQNLMGTTQKLDQARGRVSEREMNAMSVKLELQADCFAGVWAGLSQRSKGWLEQGDIEEAMNAASQIGDDTLQKRSQGSVVPESFTHGSSAQRVRWFKRGLEAGDLKVCDTFSSASL